MINHKKKILIKKHLGENTPEWIINNCIAMLNEYEEVELDGYTEAKNNEALDLVSESSFNAAIKHIKDSYCDTHINIPYMLMGDVTDLIKILTGKEIDWQELTKHSR